MQPNGSRIASGSRIAVLRRGAIRRASDGRSASPLPTAMLSTIVGIRPPDRFAREVWEELVRTGRLKGGRDNIYELPPTPPGG